MRFNKVHHHFDRRSSSAIAKYADAIRSISLACRSSRFSRSSAFILSAMSLEMPARLPLSTSAFLTQSFNVFAEHSIFAAIDVIACQRDPCWPSLSRTIRTARSRTSGENLFVVLLMMLHPTQELEPPANPGQFIVLDRHEAHQSHQAPDPLLIHEVLIITQMPCHLTHAVKRCFQKLLLNHPH